MRPTEPYSPALSALIRQLAGLPMLKQGNIDLYHRPSVHNPDGSHSSVRSMSFGTDQGETLVPTVIPDPHHPKRFIVGSDQRAIDYYNKTGKMLGIFKTIAQANRYAELLHQMQAMLYGDR